MEGGLERNLRDELRKVADIPEWSWIYFNRFKFEFTQQGCELVRQSFDKICGILCALCDDYYPKIAELWWGKIPYEKYDAHREQVRGEFCAKTGAEVLFHGRKGAVYRFLLDSTSIALKVDESGPPHGPYRGRISEMHALENIRKEKLPYTAPQPYFATHCFIAMEDLSRYQSYFAFVEQHPECKDELRNWLLSLREAAPYRLDFDAIEDQHPREAGVFVLKYDPEAAELQKKYCVAVIDVGEF